MGTQLPINLAPVAPAESIPAGGPLERYDTLAIGAGLTWQSQWYDTIAWGYLKLQAFIAAWGGTARIDYSMDAGATIHTTDALPAVPAAVFYDSGAFTPKARWAQFTYTQDIGGASGALIIEAIAGGVPTTVGGGGGIVVNVDFQGRVATQPAPNPSSVLSALADLAPIAEPDGALRTRARVLTDEEIFNDDFGNGAAALARALTGTITTVAGNPAVVGAGGAQFTAEVRVGDYIFANADTFTAATQVQSIEDDTHLTLRQGYLGANHAGVGGSVQNYAEVIAVAGGGAEIIFWDPSKVALKAATLAGGVLGNEVHILRRLGAGGRKLGFPLSVKFYAMQQVEQANLYSVFGLTMNGLDRGALFMWGGAPGSGSYVQCIMGSSNLGTDEVGNAVLLPRGKVWANEYHAYEIILTKTKVVYLCDGLELISYDHHLVDPFDNLCLWMQQYCSGVVVAAGDFMIDMVELNSIDLVNAEVSQPDPLKLRVFADGPTATALPGAYGEQGEVVLAVGVSAPILTVPLNVFHGAYYDLKILPDLTDFTAPVYTRARIGVGAIVPGASKWYASDDGTFRIGPLRAGQVVNGLVDVGDPADVHVSYARVY